MAYRFSLSGIEIKCDNLEELLQAVQDGLVTATNIKDDSPKTSPQVETQEVGVEPNVQTQNGGVNRTQAVKESWSEAQVYAKEHNVSVWEARSILSLRKRKERSEQAIAKSKTESHKGTKKGLQGSGPRQAWKEATEYAQKHGISVSEARKVLAERKRLAVKKALEKLGK